MRMHCCASVVPHHVFFSRHWLRLGRLRNVGLQIGTIREGGLYMPVDEETQISKGFAFIEFSTPQAGRTPVALSYNQLQVCFFNP